MAGCARNDWMTVRMSPSSFEYFLPEIQSNQMAMPQWLTTAQWLHIESYFYCFSWIFTIVRCGWNRIWETSKQSGDRSKVVGIGIFRKFIDFSWAQMSVLCFMIGRRGQWWPSFRTKWPMRLRKLCRILWEKFSGGISCRQSIVLPNTATYAGNDDLVWNEVANFKVGEKHRMFAEKCDRPKAYKID